MATIGLRDLFCAKVTEHENAADTYDKPVRLAKAITVELSVTVAEAVLYADDAVDSIDKEFVEGELKMNINDLPQLMGAQLLGKKVDKDGVVYSADGDDPPYYAIGFRAKKTGGAYKYVWLYKTKFGTPNEKYNTKGDSIEYSTPEIVGKFIKRPDGNWKADHVALPVEVIAQNWFNSVREPNGELSLAMLSAVVTPTTFDKTTTNANNVDVVVTVNGATTISAVKNGSTALTASQFSKDGNVLTIKKTYLDTLPEAVFTFSITTDAGIVSANVVVTQST